MWIFGSGCTNIWWWSLAYMVWSWFNSCRKDDHKKEERWFWILLAQACENWGAHNANSNFSNSLRQVKNVRRWTLIQMLHVSKFILGVRGAWRFNFCATYLLEIKKVLRISLTVLLSVTVPGILTKGIEIV